MSDYILVLSTVPDEKTGRKIGEILVQERLAACVTRSPESSSLYSWEGSIADDREFILYIKTKKELFPKVEERIKAVHPYEVPEIIALSIIAGSRDYLDWIDSETG